MNAHFTAVTMAQLLLRLRPREILAIRIGVSLRHSVAWIIQPKCDLQLYLQHRSLIIRLHQLRTDSTGSISCTHMRKYLFHENAYENHTRPFLYVLTSESATENDFFVFENGKYFELRFPGLHSNQTLLLQLDVFHHHRSLGARALAIATHRPRNFTKLVDSDFCVQNWEIFEI